MPEQQQQHREPTGPVPPRETALEHLVTLACRYRLILLTAWALLLGVRTIGHGHGDWDFFADAARALFGGAAPGFHGGGLSLFAKNPDIVTGPLTLVAVRVLSPLGPSSGYAAGVVASSLLGVVAIAGVDAAARALGRDRAAAVLLGGFVLLPAWNEIAGYGHLDDALAFALICWGLWAVAARRPVALGLCLGLAIATKQWGVTFLPLALAFDPVRDRVRAGATAIGVGLLAWLPFVIADWQTVGQAGNFQVVANDSTLALFNYPRLESPDWIRPAQLVTSLAVVTIAVLLRRWPARPARGGGRAPRARSGDVVVLHGRPRARGARLGRARHGTDDPRVDRGRLRRTRGGQRGLRRPQPARRRPPHRVCRHADRARPPGPATTPRRLAVRESLVPSTDAA